MFLLVNQFIISTYIFSRETSIVVTFCECLSNSLFLKFSSNPSASTSTVQRLLSVLNYLYSVSSNAFSIILRALYPLNATTPSGDINTGVSFSSTQNVPEKTFFLVTFFFHCNQQYRSVLVFG